MSQASKHVEWCLNKAKKEIEELNSKIYAQDPEIQELYNKGREWSLEYFENIYKRLGTKFDSYYFERDAGRIGLELVKKNIKKGIFGESKGAVIFPGEKYGLHTRVEGWGQAEGANPLSAISTASR